ncbi:hypothetical protein E2562_038431 [Oryza meyeriana var. granulata]|uniref:DM2 domain-containing protein n=1 Tax=Oryza meyeriana var. granulata TaxID=110450 RepID=A0A6G1DSB5_9ORYZ|nr:hypothetical protein E2562_038431 [Oryza meyeriana var. granulata]
MVLRRAAAAAGDCPKKVAKLVDLVNLPTALREFAGGQSQMSHLSFFLRVWSHIKNNNLQESQHWQIQAAKRPHYIYHQSSAMASE